MKSVWFYLFIIMLFTVSCASTRRNSCSADDVNEKFVELFDSIRHNVPDSTLVEYVVSMDFYKEPTSSPKEYAYYFCYCIQHKLEAYDEGINLSIYEVFTHYPQKFQELSMYLDSLLPDQEVIVKTHLCSSIAYDWIYNRSDKPRFEDFIEAYPFFKDQIMSDSYRHVYDNCLSDFTYRLDE